MSIIADTHVHLYPRLHAGNVLVHLAKNLGRLAAAAGQPDASRVACLTERQGQHVLRELTEGTFTFSSNAITLRPGAGPGALTVETGDGTVHLIGGRQFVGAERVEILGLAVELDLADGAPAATYIDRILAAGGVPVLSWAPGKWLFKREGVIRDLIARYGMRVLLGDTTLRPLGWGEPLLMRAARRQGTNVIAGSDPLPIANDDRLAGTYASLLAADFDPAASVGSVRAALRAPAPRHVGCRGNLITVARRIRANAEAKTW